MLEMVLIFLTINLGLTYWCLLKLKRIEQIVSTRQQQTTGSEK